MNDNCREKNLLKTCFVGTESVKQTNKHIYILNSIKNIQIHTLLISFLYGGTGGSREEASFLKKDIEETRM